VIQARLEAIEKEIADLKRRLLPKRGRRAKTSNEGIWEGVEVTDADLDAVKGMGAAGQR
jgi:hypothetical protein